MITDTAAMKKFCKVWRTTAFHNKHSGDPKLYDANLERILRWLDWYNKNTGRVNPQRDRINFLDANEMTKLYMASFKQ